MGRILKLINKTASQEGEEVNTSAVFFDDEKKVLDLRKKPPIFEFHFDPIKRFFREHKRNVLVIASFVLCFSILTSFFRTYASIATFYPKTCLGGWENPRFAAGAPTLKSGADLSEFNRENSAYTKDKVATLYCGEFSGEVPNGTTPNHFKLSFSWSVDNGSVDHTVSNTPTVHEEFPTNAAGNVVQPPVVEQSPASDALPTEPAPPATRLDDVVPVESGPTSFLQKIFGAKVFAQEDTPVEVIDAGAADVVTPPPATEPVVETTKEAAPSNETPATGEGAQTSNGEVEAPNTTPVVSAPDAVPSPEPIAPTDSSKPIDTSNPDKAEGFLEVLYTLDGTEWKSLGLVNQNGWKHASFDIPLSSWEDLSHLQTAVKTISSFDTSPAVYIDGMSLDVEYNEAEKVLPTIVLKDDSGIISGDINFSSTDDASFTVVDPEFSAQDFASLVQQDKADVVNDPSGVIEIRTALDGIIPSPAPGPVDPINELLDNAKAVFTKTEEASPKGIEGHAFEGSLDELLTPASAAPVLLPPTDASGSIDIMPSVLIAPPSSPVSMIPKSEKNSRKKMGSSLGIFSVLTAHADTDNATPPLEASVLDFEGKETDIPVIVTTETVGGKAKNNIRIKKPAREFRPGKYTLHVKMKTDDAIIITEQDFTWGVLAVNADRSIYQAGDTAYLQFGVLTDDGNTVCNADLDVVVKNPSGASTFFSTSDKTIVRETKCGRNNIIDVPDYYAHYKIPTIVGTYQMLVTARTVNGERTVVDHFDVMPAVSFDVERAGPTRINPLADYPVMLAVTPTTDWNGTIVEKVPSSFIIAPPAHSTPYDSQTTVGDTTYLYWNVSLLAGKEKVLGYRFDAPDVSPEFYIEGPLEFYAAGVTPLTGVPAFKEVRSWQIASDANCASPGGSTTGTWTGITWSCGHTPTTGDNVTITATDVITMNANSAVLGTITVNGTLYTSDGTSRSLSGTTLSIGSAGILAATTSGGTAATSTITLSASTGTVMTLTAGGTFTKGNSTISATGGTGGTLNSSGFTGSNSLYNLTGSTTLGADLVVSNTLTTSGGDINTSAASNYALSAGNMVLAGGYLRCNSSIVTITGFATTLITQGSQGYYGPGSTLIIKSDSGASGTTIFNGTSPGTITNFEFSPVMTASTTYTLGTNPGITGNVTVNATSSSSSNWTLTLSMGGTITLGTTKTLTVTGDTHITTALSNSWDMGFLSIGTGGILSPGSNGLTVRPASGTALTQSSTGVFTAGTSTITLVPSGSVTLNTGTWTGSNAVYNITLSSQTSTLGAAFTATNTFTANAAFDTSASNYAFTFGYWVSGSAPSVNFRASTITMTGTGASPGYCTPAIICGNGTFTTSSANFIVNGDGAPTIFGFAITINDLTFSPSISANRAYTMGTMPTINGDFTINPSGSANTLTYTLAANFATIGTTKTITIKSTGGSATGKLDTSGTNYTLSAGKFVLDNGGLLASNGSAITVSGTTGTLWTQNTGSSMTGSTSSVTFSGAANSSQTMVAGTAVSFSGNVTINNASFAAPLGAALTAVGSVTVTAGTLDTSTAGCSSTSCNITTPSLYLAGAGTTFLARAATITLSGNGTSPRPFDNQASSTFTAGTSTVVITAASGTVTFNRGAVTFYNLTINAPSATKIQPTGQLTFAAGGTFYVQAGTFDDAIVNPIGTSTSVLQVASGATYRTGTNFAPTNFTGANIQLNVNSTILFYNNPAAINTTPTYGNVQIDMSTNGVMTASTGTFTVNGNLVANGVASSSAFTFDTVTAVIAGTFTVQQTGGFSGIIVYTNGNTNNTAVSAGKFVVNSNCTFRGWTGNVTATGTSGTLITNNGTFNLWASPLIINPNASVTIFAGSAVSVPSGMTMSPAVGAGNITYTMGTTPTINSAWTINATGGPGVLTMQLSAATSPTTSLTITSGILYDAGFQITAGSGTLTIGASGTLKLGAGSATTFPVFSTANTLNVASTVIYNATVNQAISGSPTYGNLQLSAASGTPTKTLGAAATINGSITVDASNTLDVSGSNFAIGLGGNFTNNGTFTARSGTVTLSGSVTQTLTGNFIAGSSSSFYNLTITNNSGTNPSDAERTSLVSSVVFASPITSTNNYVANAAHIRVTYNSGSTYTFNNVTWAGTAGAGNLTYFRNSVAGSGTWLLKVTGTQSITYLDVSRSDASVAGGSTITATGTGNVDSGNNTNWIFTLATISGNAYNDGGTSTVWTKCNGSTANVSLVVNGGTASTTTCNAGTGAYTFSSIGISGNQPISVFFNTAGANTDQGVVTTKTAASPSATITALNPHKGYMWVQEETSAAAITNTNLDHCDSVSPASCANVPYSVTTGALTTVSGFELRLASTATFAPGGDVTTDYINVAGTYTSGTETLTLRGIGVATALLTRTGTFTQTNGTVKVTSASGTPTLLSAAVTFHILQINAAATVVNSGAAITVEDTSGAKLYVQSGVLNDSGLGIATSGSTTNTLQLDSGGVLCLGGAGGANTSATCDTSATSTTTRSMPSFLTYTFDPASTVIYLSDAATTVSQAPTYGNLKLMPVITAARTYTNGSGTMTIAGNYDINPNSAGANLLTVNAAGAISVGTTKTITITRQGATATSSLAIHPGAPQYNLSAAFINIATGGKLDCRNTTYTGTITVGGTTGTLFTNNGTFTQGNSTVLIGSTSGTPTAFGGAASTFHILKISASGATVINAGAGFTLDNTAGAKFWIASGVFNQENRTITAGITASFQIDANSTFCLGGTTAATNATCDSGATQNTAQAMPGFISFSFDPTSTVEYLSDADTNIASAPTYGNLKYVPVLTAGHIYTHVGTVTTVGDFDIRPNSAGASLLTVNSGGDITVPAGKTTTIGRQGSTANSSLVMRVTGVDYNLSTGFLNIASGGTLDCTNALTTIISISGTSGTLFTRVGAFTITGGTPTVDFTGNGTATLNSASITFYDFKQSGTGTKTIASSTTLTVNNGFTVNAGTLDPNSTTVTAAGPSTLTVANGATILVDATTFAGNYSGFGTHSLSATSTVEYKRAGTQTVDSSLTYGNLITSASGTKTLSNATVVNSTLTLNGTATLDTNSGSSYPLNTSQIIFNGGTLTANASSIGVAGTTGTPVTYTSGTFTPGTSTVMYTGDYVSGNTTIETAITYYSLMISNSIETYTPNGNVVLGSAGTLTVNDGTFDTTGSNWSVSAGYLDIGNSPAAVLIANASSLTFAGTSGTILTRGSAGTFTCGTSILTLSGNGTATINSNPFNGSNKFATLTSSGTGTKTLGGDIEAQTLITVTAGTFDTGASSILTSLKLVVGAAGSFTANATNIFLTGNSAGVFTLTSGGALNAGTSTFIFNGAGTVSSFVSGAVTGGNAFNNVLIQPNLGTNRNDTFNNNAVAINGNFTVQPSSGGLNALTLTLGGNLTVAATGTIQIDGSGSATSTLATAGNAVSAGFLVVANPGTLTAGNSTITLNGTTGVLYLLVGSGTFNANTSTFVFNPNASVSLTTGSFTGSNAFFHVSLTPTITAPRTYTMGPGAIDINGDFTINPTASSANTLLVSLQGTTTIDPNHSLTITGTTNGTGELDTTSGGNFAINTGTLTIGTLGILDANASAIAVEGNWTNNGSFNTGTSVVTLQGGNTAQVDGTTTFYDLTITHTTAKEVDFVASGGTPTFTVQNAFTVTGHAGDLMKLRSLSSPTQFDFLPTATATVDYADVQDGGCHSGAITMAPTNSVDSGNNAFCWGFAQLMTFDIDASISGSSSTPPYSVPLGVLTTATVTRSDTSAINMIVLNGATSAPSGMIITVSSSGGSGMNSISVPSDSIPSTTATMSAGSANYGLCVDSATITGFTRAAAYTTTCALGSGTNSIVGLSTSPADIVYTSGPVASGVAKVVVNAAISPVTPAHTDYSDVLTFIATGNF